MVLNCGAGRRLLRVPWTARRSNQSILKEISSEYSSEGLMLKLKLQYFGHLMWRTDSSFEKTDAGKDWKREEKGTIEDEMVGWHHWLTGHKFEYTPGVGDGQGGLTCCSPWSCKKSRGHDWTELNWSPPRGFPDGSVVKNALASEGDMGSMPGLGRCPHATEQLSPCACALEPVRANY